MNLMEADYLPGIHDLGGMPLPEGAPAMQLVRVSMVNWYAFSKQDLEIRGNTSFIGPNGAGKSSVIDAIQLVLTGANKNLFKANASADRLSGDASFDDRRNIFDYCVGKVAGRTLREISVTGLALVFRSSLTGRSHSIGLMMSARVEEGREKMLGSFVVDGEMTSDDFLIEDEDVPGAYFTRTWDEFRKHLSKFSNVDVLSGEQKGTFVSKAFGRICGRTIDTDAYLDALRKALAFKKMDDPTQFVRSFVLPRPELTDQKVARSKESYENYRELEERIQAVIAEIDEIEGLRNRAESISGQRSSLLAHRWARTNMKLLGLKSEADALRGNVERHRAAIEEAKSRRTKAREEVISSNLVLDELERSSENSAIMERVDALSQEIARLERRQRAAQADVDSILRSVLSMERLVPMISAMAEKGSLGLISVDTAETIRLFCSLVRERSFGAEHIALAKETVAGIVDQSLARERELVGEDELIRRESQQDVAMLKEAEKSGRVLSPQILDLQVALAETGIDSKPLCELASVTAPDWRQAVETLLGRAREALFVHPGDVSRAINFVHANRDRFFSCEVFDAHESTGSPRPVRPGSLASVVSFTDDPLSRYGRELLSMRIGDIMMVDAPDDLRSHQRAVTRDVMVKSGGTIGFRRQQSNLIMGSRGASTAIETLRIRVGESVSRRRLIESELSALRAIGDEARGVIVSLSGLDRLGESMDELKKVSFELGTQRTRRSSLEKTVDMDVVRRVEEARMRKSDAAKVADEVDNELSRLDRVSSEEDTRLKRINAAISDVESEMEDMGATEAVRSEGRDVVARLSGTASEIEALIRNLESRIRSSEQIWQRDVGAYVSRSTADTPPSGEFDDTVLWLGDRSRDLEGNVLIGYREESREARRTMTMTIINDVMVGIGSDMEKGKKRLREINMILKDRVFGGEFYQFTWRENGDFSDLLKLSEEAMRGERDLDDLFDMTLDEDDAFSDDAAARGFRKMRRMFEQRSNEIDALSDYRNFMLFDLVSKSVKDEELMSDFNLQQKRSGGERQIPFYVAIGTALTSVLHRGRARSGMGLGMFDEAFNALDTRNTGVSLDLLGEMGMQWIVSAPTDKQVPLARASQTIVNISRAGTHVQLDVEYPNEEARKELDRAAQEAISAEDAARIGDEEG